MTGPRESAVVGRIRLTKQLRQAGAGGAAVEIGRIGDVASCSPQFHSTLKGLGYPRCINCGGKP